MDLLITLVVFLIAIGVVFWVARALIGAFQIPEPIATVVYVILVLVALFVLLDLTGLLGRFRLRN